MQKKFTLTHCQRALFFLRASLRFSLHHCHLWRSAAAASCRQGGVWRRPREHTWDDGKRNARQVVLRPEAPQGSLASGGSARVPLQFMRRHFMMSSSLRAPFEIRHIRDDYEVKLNLLLLLECVFFLILCFFSLVTGLFW